MEIENKRVVVTGGASGIGKALCEAFQASGAKSIVVVDMNYEDAKKTADITGGLAIKANVAVEEVENVIEEANVFAGGIDIFCSNAGIIGVPGFMEASVEDWNNMWSVNVMSHIHAAKHTPQMLERGEGYLVNTASAAGLLTQIGAAGCMLLQKMLRLVLLNG